MIIFDEVSDISEAAWRAWRMDARVERGKIIEAVYRELFQGDPGTKTDYEGDIDRIGITVLMSDGRVPLTVDRAYPISALIGVDAFVDAHGLEIVTAQYFAAQCLPAREGVAAPYEIVFGTVGKR